MPDARVDLVRGGRGDFIVKVDGRELWNKRADDSDFPAHGVILERLAAQA